MALPADFAEMMQETITVFPAATLDAYGKQSWGAGVDYPCRIMGEQRILRDKEGREVVESGRAVVYGVVPNVSVNDKVTLPSGLSPLVTSVDAPWDEDGAPHHTVIGFGV